MHGIFRVQVYGRAHRHAEGGCPRGAREPTYAGWRVGSTSFAAGAFSYFDHSALTTALCHLDNGTTRVGYKLAKKLGRSVGHEASRLRAQHDGRRGSLDGYSFGRLGNSRRYYALERVSSLAAVRTPIRPADDLLRSLGFGNRSREIVDELPGGEYTDGDGSILYFEAYGRGHDMLLMGTWDALRVRRETIIASACSQATKDKLQYDNRQAHDLIPPSPQRPADWQCQNGPLRSLFDELKSRLPQK